MSEHHLSNERITQFLADWKQLPEDITWSTLRCAIMEVVELREQLAAAEVAFKNEVQIVIEQRESIESLIWRFRDMQFPRDAVQTAIDLVKEVSDE